VRAIALDPEQPLIASVGLDRFLRLHHTQTRKLCAKVYLKQQLTGWRALLRLPLVPFIPSRRFGIAWKDICALMVQELFFVLSSPVCTTMRQHHR
jgi:hypothetical protein